MRPKKILQACLRRLGYEIRWIPRALARRPDAQLHVSLELAVARRCLDVPRFFFVQVGAFDGICVDPISELRTKFGWSGIMIEPQPVAFARLARNLAGQPQLKLLQLAVSDEEGDLPFFALDPATPNAPAKAPLIASLSREMLRRELDPGVDWAPWIRETRVPCRTLNSILAQEGVTQLDLLQIDAEGHDARILHALDFSRWSPHLIHYEHTRLAPAEAERCWEMLIERGYQLHVSPPDTLAVRRPPA